VCVYKHDTDARRAKTKKKKGEKERQLKKKEGEYFK
jgi:hypothetical protein